MLLTREEVEEDLALALVEGLVLATDVVATGRLLLTFFFLAIFSEESSRSSNGGREGGREKREGGREGEEGKKQISQNLNN